MNIKTTDYLEDVNSAIEYQEIENKAYHSELPTGKTEDGLEWDGLGISEESNVRHIHCSECGELCSDVEITIFKRKSKVKENMCKNCHSHSTANMTEQEMAEEVMEYLPIQKENDVIWTLANQFKTRDDLAFMLMAISNNKFQVKI